MSVKGSDTLAISELTPAEREAVFLAALSQVPHQDCQQVLRDLHALSGSHSDELAPDE